MSYKTNILSLQINPSKRFAFAIFSIIIIALYGKTYHYGFVMDDGIVWAKNQFVLQGLSGIRNIFLTDAFEGYLRNIGADPMSMGGGRYRPLSMAFFAVLNQIFGTNPTAGHIANIFFYILSTYVLFLFISKLLDFYHVSNAGAKSFLATIIFAIHPVHTEVVANIKSMDENICFLFGMAALVILLENENKKSFSSLLWTSICMLVSLLSKETSVVLIPIYILLLWGFNGADALWRAIKKAAPLIISFLVYMAFRVNAVGLGGGSSHLEDSLLNNPFLKMDAGRAMLPFSFSEKASAIALGLLKYLQLLIFPFHLTHDYYPRYFPVSNFGSNSLAVLSLLVYAALIYVIYYYRKSRRIISFLTAFYLISILIFSNIFFNIGANLAERFLFLPSVSWVIILSLLFFHLRKSKSLHLLRNGLLLFIFVFYSVKTFTRNGAWQDNYTLAVTDVKISDNSVRALAFAASELLVKNNDPQTRKIAEIRKAIGYIEKSVSMYPYVVDNYVTMANLYQMNQEWDKAIYFYDYLLSNKINNPDINTNLATCYLEAGKKLSEENKAKEGLNYIQKAWQYRQDAETKKMLGVAYARNFQYKDAEYIFKEVLKSNPADSSIKQYLDLVKVKKNTHELSD